MKERKLENNVIFALKLFVCMAAVALTAAFTAPILAEAAPSAKAQLFDAAHYAAKYADAAAAFGTDSNKLFNHYINYGIKEGRDASAEFNAIFYKANNPDLASAFGDNLLSYALHYTAFGKAEGRKGNGNFPFDTGNMLTDLLNLVNNERAKVGAQMLAYDDKLVAVAILRVAEIESLFSHVRPDGSSCFTAFGEAGATGYGFEWKGENLATGYSDAPSVFKAWMDSPGHKENILRSEFNKVGFAKKDTYWAQAFGG